MTRKILIIAAALTALVAALPAQAGYGGIPNGVSLNGFSLNGGTWNGARANGVEQSTAGAALLAIELPPASH